MPAIHVALAFDDKYWAPAYATMRSICLSTLRHADLVFHLFHGPLTPAHRDVLERIPPEFGATIRLYAIEEDERFAWLLREAPHDSRLPSLAYARLMFGEVMPPEVERLIYLDCDMMMRAPVERLAEMDLGGKAIAAAPDYLGQLIMARRDLIDKRGIFNPGMRYFNSGLLVIDLARWREVDVMARFREAMASGLMQKLYYDQDFLNLTFKDNWLELNQLWNFLDPKPVHEPLNPFLLHYTGLQKPWLVGNKAAFPMLYRYVMTNDVFYRYLAERVPGWMKPLVRAAHAINSRT